MVLLPVVERELRVAARGRAIYRVRFYALLLLLGVFLWIVKASGLASESPSEMGKEAMIGLILCAFGFALFIGVLATADCVSSEKREGTLGLLFLTDLKGYDVICGKLAANSLTAFYGLLAMLPVLSLPVMMGGVTFGQFAKLAMTLFSTMVLSLAVGIFVSTHSRNERKAMFFTVLFLLAAASLPLVLPAWYDSEVRSIPQKVIWRMLLFSPAYGIGDTMDTGSAFPPFAYWLSTLWQWLVAAILIIWASIAVSHSWEESGAKKKSRRVRLKAAAPAKSRTATGRSWLERNPFFWLALQGDEASPSRVWFFVAAILAILVIAAFKFGLSLVADKEMLTMTVYILHAPLKVWIAAEASRRFSEDRSNHAFESLLATPLSAHEIIGGQWLALLRQFAAPMGVVLVWEFVLMIYSSGQHFGWQPVGPMDYWPHMLLFVADSAALAWTGMWLGLVCRGRIRAILGSLLLVLLIPAVITLMIMIMDTFPVRVNITSSPLHPESYWETRQMLASLVPSLLMDAMIIVWATWYLPNHLRKLAVRR